MWYPVALRNGSGDPSAKAAGSNTLVVAGVFAASAALAAILFTLDARQSRDEQAQSSSTAPAGETIATATTAGTQEAAARPQPALRTTASVTVAEPIERLPVDPPDPTPAPTGRPPPNPTDPDAPCAADAVLVDGHFCPFVAHTCERTRRQERLGIEPPCEAFKDQVLCQGALKRLRFCIDRFEYPNREGALPAVLVSFDEAERACEADGKRLCNHYEWTFACEGEAIVPYPIGLERTPATCNWDAGPESPVVPSQGPRVASALLAVDKRTAAGERPACKSPFEVQDLAGNVAEWTRDPTRTRSSPPFVSVIAGGAWGSSPSTCRTLEDSQPPPHRSSLLGFRCCSDPYGPAAAKPPTPRPRGGLRPIYGGASKNPP